MMRKSYSSKAIVLLRYIFRLDRGIKIQLCNKYTVNETFT